METMEMPMTQGVAQDINLETSTVDIEETLNVSEDPAMEVEEATSDVDTLLLNAREKGDGLEDVLEKIADGDFVTDEEETESESEEVEEPEEVEQTEDELETLSPEDEIELIEKVVILEDKVDRLLDETKELSEKLDKIVGDRGSMSKEEFFEMIMLLYKMMKEEENKKKKVSFLEFMIKLIGIFMQSIADPEVFEKANVGKEQEQVSEKPSNISSMIEYLEKNGGFKNAEQKMVMPREAPQPQVEAA